MSEGGPYSKRDFILLIKNPPIICQCADVLLGDLLLKTDPDKVSKDVHEVLRALKKLAVIPIATCIVRSELLGMK